MHDVVRRTTPVLTESSGVVRCSVQCDCENSLRLSSMVSESQCGFRLLFTWYAVEIIVKRDDLFGVKLRVFLMGCFRLCNHTA